MLVDSNIIIYAAQPEYKRLRRFIAEQITHVSAVTYVEVLGYHRLTATQRTTYQGLFQSLYVLPISSDIVDQAIILRQQRKLGLGDALIAATALVHKLAVVTRNVSDFRWIEGISVLDPFDALGLE
ncbi:MAG: type II toxin-antitoxin system VapC family toxin [Caldilineaceae bacterium]|nr:type II toxin-antitoxin system VapC family toxin [Caldilineaceae bacterium]MBP8105993.1 type II toxin-antitoxin system VapC family toxin [Caldilineaceae bacterium]MBP8123679.1 type II toxin-antitoxin system VapC family toxin [Caldilineaceae bacterium]MBP9071913.1 type II toxin-antitoxin system VapC family toxin [Caldilineaceae bacterium]